MRKTRFQRVLALLLAVTSLMGGASLAVSAETSRTVENPTVTDKTIADYQTELNTITYAEYVNKYAAYGKPSGTIVVNAADALDASKTDSDYTITDEYGKNGVYTPETGTTAWTFDVPEAGWYQIAIEYYSVMGKNTAIEREFYINGVVPFKEAYSLSLKKQYAYTYTDGTYKLGKKDDSAALLAKAESLGINAHAETRDNGECLVFEMPEYWTAGRYQFLSEELGVRFFTMDTEGNELRPAATQVPVWSEYSLRDASGYRSDNYGFALDAGRATISLVGVNEPVVISKITLTPIAARMTYAEYLESLGDVGQGSGVIRIESEYATNASSSTIYAVEDRTNAACSPSDPSKTVLNTFGGTQWQTSGQTISYSFRVDQSGMYEIVARFKQSTLEGLFVGREISIYSGDGVSAGDKGYYNGIPFEEATKLQFGYDSKWQVKALGTGASYDTDGKKTEDGKTVQFYFEAGVTYTVTFGVAFGAMGSLISEIETALNTLNNDYLTILKLTGPSPDKYRDYGFERLIPSTLKSMGRQADTLEAISKQLVAISGTSTSNTATLDTVVNMIRKMVSDPDGQIARNLESYKSYLGTLGTFLGDAKTQPLQLDYLQVQPESTELPRANAGFWSNFVHEFLSFIWSFFRDYNQMGSMTESKKGEEVLEVWVAYGRDQSQVIRNLITNDFTPNYNTPASLKLVASGTLLPSILAQAGPDVFLGLTQLDVINYAVRSALIPIEDMPGFDEVRNNFNEAAMLVLQIEDSEGKEHYYGLPETESFYMMFVRLDILGNLGLDIPKTWTDIYAALPVLEANSLTLGMATDGTTDSVSNQFQILLYQNGGQLYADGGMRINLDNEISLQSFETMCDFFTAYSCPYAYDAANRFRSGETPIVMAKYTDLYNKLKVFATEIEGLWAIVPLPGVADANGKINNCSIATTTAAVMVSGVKEENKSAAWDFMKWYTGKDCQVGYANDMVAVLGESGKHPTANREALASLPWSHSEYEEVIKQYNNLAAVPNYPGSYYLNRYIGFAFLAAYNSAAEPRSSLLGYINIINNELIRKREEFGLETLAIGQTLADKRMNQALNELATLSGSTYDQITEEVRYAVANKNIKLLTLASADLEELAGASGISETVREKLLKISEYLAEAVKALESY